MMIPMIFLCLWMRGIAPNTAKCTPKCGGYSPTLAICVYRHGRLVKRKHTAAVFGRIISTYTTQEAIDDKAILPLLYEARIDNLSLDANIDEWFEKYTAGLAEDKQAKYKRSFPTPPLSAKPKSYRRPRL